VREITASNDINKLISHVNRLINCYKLVSTLRAGIIGQAIKIQHIDIAMFSTIKTEWSKGGWMVRWKKV